MAKKVKLPRKRKKKFINERWMGSLKYWIQRKDIADGKRLGFDKVIKGVSMKLYKENCNYYKDLMDF